MKSLLAAPKFKRLRVFLEVKVLSFLSKVSYCNKVTREKKKERLWHHEPKLLSSAHRFRTQELVVQKIKFPSKLVKKFTLIVVLWSWQAFKKKVTKVSISISQLDANFGALTCWTTNLAFELGGSAGIVMSCRNNWFRN